MRAISLWQPWASAVALGSKRIETRGWRTDYRGPLAIHAAQRLVQSELMSIKSTWNWCGALKPLGLEMGGDKHLWELLPFGALVATCELVDCRPTDSFTQAELHTRRMPEGETLDIYGWTEAMLGNFALGRFGWVLDNIRALPEPIPIKGRPGFFSVPDALLQEGAHG